MTKIKELLFILIVGVVSTHACFAQSESAPKDKPSSIIVKLKEGSSTLTETTKDSHICGESETHYYHTRLIPLRNSDSIVVAIVFDSGQKLILNPEINKKNIEIVYGSIPTLKELTKDDCNHLWTEFESHKKDEVTYKFSGLNLRVNREPSDFYIDIVFRKNHINKYRIRNKYLDKQEHWISVQSGEEA